jgi:hypothetical protein
LDELNIVAVGNTNAVAYTQNGGSTWTSLTGPNVGVNLLTVSLRSQNEWWIGDAGGKLGQGSAECAFVDSRVWGTRWGVGHSEDS